MFFKFNPATRVASVLLFAASFSPTAFADCTFGTPSGGEAALQVSLGNLLSSPPDVTTGCLADGIGREADAYWSGVGSTSATVLLEIAGFADINSFGIFDSSNPVNRLAVFAGPAGPGARALIAFAPDGTVSITSAGYTRSAQFGSAAIGFYLLTGQGNVMHSDSALNAGGRDRMYAYRGNGASFIGGPVIGDGDPSNDIFTAGDAILAYEDLLDGDNDFQDFVVLVRGVQPVPLPAAAWLFGGGLFAMRAFARPRPA